MGDIIDRIIHTEERAKQIVEESRRKAAEMRAQSQTETTEILEEARSRAQKLIQDRVSKAQAEADSEYERMISEVQEKGSRFTAENQEHLEKIKRFDMPGFRPNVHYIREMKRYGILPETFGDDDPIDVYQTDQAYWKSLWHQPAPR